MIPENENTEARLLRQNICYMIQQAYLKGYQQRCLEEYREKHSVLMEAEEVRMDYQWKREGF